jgi:hypothetical protein
VRGFARIVLAVISGACAILLYADSAQHPTNLVYASAALLLALWLTWTGAKKIGGDK